VRVPVLSNQFKRDVKLAQRRGKDMSKLHELVALLLEEKPLPARYRDHASGGEWKGVRDAHVGRDWLLLYSISGDELQLFRTGSHSDLLDR
jgi:mRNA interferase YafQ